MLDNDSWSHRVIHFQIDLSLVKASLSDAKNIQKIIGKTCLQKNLVEV